MIATISELKLLRRSWAGQRVVATNGCFDILHAGHVRYLEYARTLGDRLVVGLNSDRSVSELKGPGRPVNNQNDRAEILSALRCVDDVCIFDGVRCVDFLIAAAPDVYVKGGDYTEDTMDRNERMSIASATIVFFPLVAGRSTTAIMSKWAGPIPGASIARTA